MRRSRIDIIIDVLEVAKMGINKTGVVYRTNLNFKLADKYLDMLQKQGLVENRVDKYITTNKGKMFLEKAREITLLL
jgi:predicted transcriptional regulator